MYLKEFMSQKRQKKCLKMFFLCRNDRYSDFAKDSRLKGRKAFDLYYVDNALTCFENSAFGMSYIKEPTSNRITYKELFFISFYLPV